METVIRIHERRPHVIFPNNFEYITGKKQTINYQIKKEFEQFVFDNPGFFYPYRGVRDDGACEVIPLAFYIENRKKIKRGTTVDFKNDIDRLVKIYG